MAKSKKNEDNNESIKKSKKTAVKNFSLLLNILS